MFAERIRTDFSLQRIEQILFMLIKVAGQGLTLKITW